jgi:hypothetical protein
MNTDTRQVLAIVVFILLTPVMMLTAKIDAEALHYEVREVEEE